MIKKDKYTQEIIVKYIEFLHYTCKYQILRSMEEYDDRILHNPNNKELIDRTKKILEDKIDDISILDEITEYLKIGHNLEWFDQSYLYDLQGYEYYLKKWKKEFKKK